MATDLAAHRAPAADAHDWLALVGFILVCQAAGAAGALVTEPGFYQALVRPAWAPPPWLFGPVWISLYTLMGIAAWLVWRHPRSPDRSAALVSFAVQLLINAAWTPVFFGARSIGGGLLVIAALDAAIFYTIIRFGRVSTTAAWLMVPYAAWVGFATALNTSLWLLNG